MRYYDIQISGGGGSTANPSDINGAASGITQSAAASGFTSSFGSGLEFSSLANGVNDPGALDIEFEFQWDLDKDGLTDHLKIKGIDPHLISQAVNLNYQNVKMWGGFSPGLPLATDQVPHRGLILNGTIFPAFGNWIGNELSLEMFVVKTSPTGLVGGPTKPINLIHNMPKGTSLSSAIQKTLSTAFPGFQINVAISNALKLNYDDKGFYQGIEQYINYIKTLSHSILGAPPQYYGVSVSSKGQTISVTDGTQPGNPVIINYQDLIGQPTWIGINTIQVKTQLRGDILLPGQTWIQLPKTLVTQTQAGGISLPSQVSSSNLLFQGNWKVIKIRHIGSFRSPSAESWVTIIDALQPSSGSSSGGANSQPTTSSSGKFTPSTPSGGPPINFPGQP